jgi:hypothetical protein
MLCDGTHHTPIPAYLLSDSVRSMGAPSERFKSVSAAVSGWCRATNSGLTGRVLRTDVRNVCRAAAIDTAIRVLSQGTPLLHASLIVQTANPC